MPKRRAHDAFGHRLAHQELLRALAGFVVVIDQPVVRRLEAIEFLGLAADGERREQHVVAVVGDRRFFLAGVEHFEGIAGLHLALEIDVVGVDADQFVDDRARNLIAHRGLVDALIEPHAGGVVVVGCRRKLSATSVSTFFTSTETYLPVSDSATTASIDASLATITRIGCSRWAPGTGASSTRSFWPSLMPPSRPRGPSTLVIAPMSSGVAPRSRNMVATLSPFLADDHAFVEGIAAGGLAGGLRQQRDVLRHDARFEAGIRIGACPRRHRRA